MRLVFRWCGREDSNCVPSTQSLSNRFLASGPPRQFCDQMSLNRAANHPERTGVRPPLERYCWSISSPKGCDFRTHNSEIVLFLEIGRKVAKISSWPRNDDW
jgi:hypothetical protein